MEYKETFFVTHTFGTSNTFTYEIPLKMMCKKLTVKNIFFIEGGGIETTLYSIYSPQVRDSQGKLGVFYEPVFPTVEFIHRGEYYSGVYEFNVKDALGLNLDDALIGTIAIVLEFQQ